MLKAGIVLIALTGLFGCGSTSKPTKSVQLETETYHACAELSSYSIFMRNSHFAKAWQLQLKFDQDPSAIPAQTLMDEYKTSTENVEFINLSSLYHDYLLFNKQPNSDAAFTSHWQFSNVFHGDTVSPVAHVKVKKEELRWLKEQAACDDSSAQYALGLIYLNGLELAQNTDKAIQYLTLAAARGHVRAQYQLGMIYAENAEYDEALTWLRLTKQAGHPQVGDYLAFLQSQIDNE